MSLWSRISNAVRGERLNREIEEELQLHIEEAIASGRDPGEARRTFGSILRQREASHSIRAAGWLESLLVRYKIRVAAALAKQGHVVGRCAFSRPRHRLLCRRLPSYRRPALAPAAHLQFQQALRPLPQDDRLVRQACRGRILGHAGLQAYARCRQGPGRPDRHQRRRPHGHHLGAPTTTWRRPTSFMSPATCSRSSALSPRSAGCSSPLTTAAPVLSPYAVLSWDYWNHRFGRDPHVLGRSVHIGDQTFEIIGVVPAISPERKRERSPTSFCL